MYSFQRLFRYSDAQCRVSRTVAHLDNTVANPRSLFCLAFLNCSSTCTCTVLTRAEGGIGKTQRNTRMHAACVVSARAWLTGSHKCGAAEGLVRGARLVPHNFVDFRRLKALLSSHFRRDRWQSSSLRRRTFSRSISPGLHGVTRLDQQRRVPPPHALGDGFHSMHDRHGAA